MLETGKHPSDLSVWRPPLSLGSLPAKVWKRAAVCHGRLKWEGQKYVRVVLSNGRAFDARAVRLISTRVRRMYAVYMAVETTQRLPVAAEEMRSW